MRPGYINQQQKQDICSIVGINVYVQDLLKEERLPMFKEIKRNLKGMTYHADKLITTVMNSLDENVQAGLLRFSKSIDLICVSRGDPRGKDPMHLITEDEMLWLISGHHDCLFCEKKGKEITQCPLRKIALRCQLIPAGKGECPFWRDM